MPEWRRLADRNRPIKADFKNGVSVQALMYKHEISRARIYQIIKQTDQASRENHDEL